jgi:hypothetical protein
MNNALIEDSADALLQTSASPDIDLLLREFEDAGGYLSRMWRAEYSDKARFTRWDGQDPSGRKRRELLGDDCLPWDNAADTRQPLVDGIIRDLAAVLTTAGARAQVKAIPASAANEAKAGQVAKLVNHFRQQRRRELGRERDLVASYLLSYGLAVWQVGWARSVSYTRTRISLEQIANEFPQGPDLVSLVLDPAQEEAAVDAAIGLLGTLSRPQARRVVRELRNSGTAEVPRPYVTYHGPEWTARKVNGDIFFPAATTDMQRARCVFIRDFLTETELRANVLTDGWDEAWVEAALKTRGQVVTWEDSLTNVMHEGDTYSMATRLDTKDQLVEVVWAYVRTVDKDDVPEVCCTVFCPNAAKSGEGKEIWAKHGPVGYAHGKYPFVEIQQERVSRRLVDSRGVPEVSATWQDEIKTQCDMLEDRATLEVNPTLLVPPTKFGQKYRVGPGLKLEKPLGGNKGLEYLEPPSGNPKLAFEVIGMVMRRAAEYWGLPHPEVVPAKWQARLQQAVENFLAAEEEVCAQTLQLAQQYLTDEELARIGGGLEGFPTSAADIAGEFDFQLVFDARDLDMEFTFKKLDAISKLVVPNDRGGAIDYSKLTALALASIDPTMAQTILQDQQGAAGKVFDQVNKDVAFMALGNEPQYPQNDPTAQMKQQFLQVIVQNNPKYQQALASDERFRELMENYNKSLQQSVTQLGQNVVTGRTGVKPVGAA